MSTKETEHAGDRAAPARRCRFAYYELPMTHSTPLLTIMLLGFTPGAVAQPWPERLTRTMPRK